MWWTSVARIRRWIDVRVCKTLHKSNRMHVYFYNDEFLFVKRSCSDKNVRHRSKYFPQHMRFRDILSALVSMAYVF
jgi:hypothetical protein